MFRTKHRQWLRSASPLTILLALSGAATANPLDGEVVAGQATITAPNPALLEIEQYSDRAIVDWRQFNIGVGETTRFIQPSAEAWILNRVVGGDSPSSILGTLEANGNVVIVNPDGIHFGAGSQVDVNRLIATTADIDNTDFMAGNLNFSKPGSPSASIVNEGTISVRDYGLSALVAPGVRNSGTITARLGSISLAAGNVFTIDPYGDGLVKLAIGDEIQDEVIDVATGQRMSDLVKNEGTLKADGGVVAMTAATARTAINSVVNNTGVIEANSVGMRGGKIVLGGKTAGTKLASAPAQRVRVAGTVRATVTLPKNGPIPQLNPRGHIEITGEEIIAENASIDASGTFGGGTVLIGGDYMGGKGDPAVVKKFGIALEDNAIETASEVRVDASSTISADALNAGNGGKVVIWSDGNTAFAGNITAQGNANEGKGGFVEVSGRGQLAFSGTVDVSSPLGHNGTLLLDPTDATIGNTGDWIITPASIIAALENGNVYVTTTNGDGNGDLTVAEDVMWSSGNSLTLASHRNVAVNADITSTGGADVTVRADKNGTGVGTITFADAATITTSGQVTLMFNPSVNPAGSEVNRTSYASPTEDFSPHLSAGSSISYMLVNTVYDLQNLENNLDGNYAVGRDIDASETATWTDPVFGWVNGFTTLGTRDLARNSTYGFTGSLDGYGHTIDGLTILGDKAFSGLFGAINGSVRNLVLSDMDVRGDFVGYMGGLAAYTLPGSIISYVSVIDSRVLSDGITGGLIGYNQGTVNVGFFSGETAGNFSFPSGGLVGQNYGVIQNSISFGDVGRVIMPWGTYYASTSGGLVGANYGTILDSYSGANVYGTNTTGGLVGYQLGNANSITSSYSFGMVDSAPNTGGLIGDVGAGNSPSAVVNSYWNTVTSGVLTSAGGVGLTTAQLQTGLPIGFDPAIWGQDPSINNGMPHLLWQTAGQTAPILLLPKRPALNELPTVVLNPEFLFDTRIANSTQAILEKYIKEGQSIGGFNRIFSGSASLTANEFVNKISPIVYDIEDLYYNNGKMAYLDLGSIGSELGIPESTIKLAKSFGFNASLYKLEDGNIALIFEGSGKLLSLDLLDDWLTNLLNITSTLSPVVGSGNLYQYAFGNYIASMYKRIYGERLVVSGHSLGGSIATYAAGINGIKALAFDPSTVEFSGNQIQNGIKTDRILNIIYSGGGVGLRLDDVIPNHIGATIKISREILDTSWYNIFKNHGVRRFSDLKDKQLRFEADLLSSDISIKNGTQLRIVENKP